MHGRIEIDLFYLSRSEMCEVIARQNIRIFTHVRYISPRETRVYAKRSYCTHLSVVAFCWKDVWHEHNTQKLVAGDNTVARVSSLKPATTYHFRVLAENHLGTSAPSDILHVSIKHCRKTKKKETKHDQKENFHIITNIITRVNVRRTVVSFSRAPWVASRNFRNRCKRTAKYPVDRPGTSPWSPWARSSSRSRGNRRIDPCGTANYSDTSSATPISGIIICLLLLSRGTLRHLAFIIKLRVSNNDCDDPFVCIDNAQPHIFSKFTRIKSFIKRQIYIFQSINFAAILFRVKI